MCENCGDSIDSVGRPDLIKYCGSCAAVLDICPWCGTSASDNGLKMGGKYCSACDDYYAIEEDGKIL